MTKIQQTTRDTLIMQRLCQHPVWRANRAATFQRCERCGEERTIDFSQATFKVGPL